MQLQRSYNRLRLCLVSTDLTSQQKLGMQPVFLYPRRSRFAPLQGMVLRNLKTNLKDHQTCRPVSWPIVCSDNKPGRGFCQGIPIMSVPDFIGVYRKNERGSGVGYFFCTMSRIHGQVCRDELWARIYEQARRPAQRYFAVSIVGPVAAPDI